MPYLGQNPTVGNFVKLDSISTVDGQATYNLTLDSTAFTPESANHMLVVVNGIVQSPTTNYTVSGSTITFTGNLVTGDVINEIRVFGDVLNIGTPSDATVTNAKTNFVSTSSAAGLSIKGDGTTDGTLQLNCSQNSHGVKIASPAHSAGQSYTIKLPTENIAADKIMKVASITGSGTSAVGQMSFVDAPSGGLVPLLTSTASSSSSVNFYSVFSDNTTYKDFFVIGSDIKTTSSSTYFRCHYSINGTSIDQASGRYRWTLDGRGAQNDTIDWYTQAQSYMALSDDGKTIGSGHVFGFYMYLLNPQSSEKSYHGGKTFGSQGGEGFFCDFMALSNVAQATTGISFSFSSGTISSGEFTVYGIARP